jgi:hypothetical protein
MVKIRSEPPKELTSIKRDGMPNRREYRNPEVSEQNESD